MFPEFYTVMVIVIVTSASYDLKYSMASNLQAITSF